MSILVISDSREHPEGICIQSNLQLCLVSKDFKTLYFSNNLSFLSYDISEFHLNPEEDRLLYASMFDDTRIFAYGIREKIPTGFLYSIEPDKSPFPKPQVLSFALDSMSFHQRVLAAFVPAPNYFCVVSKEGITIHNHSFYTLHSIPFSISYCCFHLNYLLLGTNLHSKQIFYHIQSDGTPIKIKEMEDSGLGSVFQIISLSHSLLLIIQDGNRSAIIQKIELTSQHALSPIALQSFFNLNTIITQLKFFPFDDALFVSDNNGNSILIDFMESHCITIGSIFKFLPNLLRPYINSLSLDFMTSPTYSCNYSYFADDKMCYKVTLNLNILDENKTQKIAAILRRSTGLSHAMYLIGRYLKSVDSVEKMNELVLNVGPSAVAPIAQIRFARAIQFSGINNPHLILLGLLKFSSIMKLTDQALIPLIEMISHSSCRYALKNLLTCYKMKLNKSALRVLLGKCDESFTIEPEFVENLLDFANICIDFGRQKEARRLILRLILQGDLSNEQTQFLKQRYNDRFSVEMNSEE